MSAILNTDFTSRATLLVEKATKFYGSSFKEGPEQAVVLYNDTTLAIKYNNGTGLFDAILQVFSKNFGTFVNSNDYATLESRVQTSLDDLKRGVEEAQTLSHDIFVRMRQSSPHFLFLNRDKNISELLAVTEKKPDFYIEEDREYYTVAFQAAKQISPLSDVVTKEKNFTKDLIATLNYKSNYAVPAFKALQMAEGSLTRLQEQIEKVWAGFLRLKKIYAEFDLLQSTINKCNEAMPALITKMNSNMAQKDEADQLLSEWATLKEKAQAKASSYQNYDIQDIGVPSNEPGGNELKILYESVLCSYCFTVLDTAIKDVEKYEITIRNLVQKKMSRHGSVSDFRELDNSQHLPKLAELENKVQKPAPIRKSSSATDVSEEPAPNEPEKKNSGSMRRIRSLFKKEN